MTKFLSHGWPADIGRTADGHHEADRLAGRERGRTGSLVRVRAAAQLPGVVVIGTGRPKVGCAAWAALPPPIRSCDNRGVVGRAFGEPHSPPSHISKIVPPTIHLGPPQRTVDTTIFEMWLGSLSTHRGLSIPAL